MLDSDIKHSIEQYWDKRADGYSSRTRRELESFKEQVWLDLISEYAPNKICMQVLDIGTGPGFFPLVLSRAGHMVTVIDCSQEMVAQAKENAAKQGLSPQFLKMDCHRLDFADASFDLVICRNLTWTLSEPQAAYAEWLRVLRPGGRLLVFDANWYLRLFDERLKAEYAKELLAIGSHGNLDNPHLGVDVQESERIAYTLPLSRVLRPGWDIPVLQECGFSEVVCLDDIAARVWDESEQILFKSTPLFMICAIK